ncbi:MAG: hypothetical protein GX601_18350 [Anaerolineales bacterium]|nr:hypothetical protein [Anaerolineales bacterium]
MSNSTETNASPLCQPTALSLKPDLPEAAERWEAFYAGEIIDRPVVCVTAPREGAAAVADISYRERAFGDIDTLIDHALARAESLYWGGEAVPSFFPSIGPDEIAVFIGAELRWSDDSGDTNWSVPWVEDWEQALPLRLHADHSLYQRLLAVYRRGAERLAGKMLLSPPDLHTNMDLLAAIRGPQRLCLDLLDQPDVIDRAMDDARAIFRELWAAVTRAGRMDELGYCHAFYSPEGAAVLQCDFGCMISPTMFRRWVLPALEEEAAIVRHALYHWDGPGALVHTADLLASRGLFSMSYVPGSGHGEHIDYLELFRRVQAGGKAVQVYGTPEQLKVMHRELKPEKVHYHTHCDSVAEAEALLSWFTRNT